MWALDFVVFYRDCFYITIFLWAMDTCQGHITHVFKSWVLPSKVFLFLKQLDTMIKNSISGTLLKKQKKEKKPTCDLHCGIWVCHVLLFWSFALLCFVFVFVWLIRFFFLMTKLMWDLKKDLRRWFCSMEKVQPMMGVR